MSFQRFLSTSLCALLVISASAAHSVDVRLNHNSFDVNGKSLYVDIQVRVEDRDHINLAGQNYRIYYPTDKLSLDIEGSRSELPKEKYSALKASSILEHVDALGQGMLPFDKDLGFANLSVELLDNQTGGSTLNGVDGWQTIATLKFIVVSEFDHLTMIWGREGMSDTYATAFVEIAEWQAPSQTASVRIDEYFDFNLELKSVLVEGTSYEISIGPNPTIEFVTIQMDKPMSSDMTASILDLSGKLVKKTFLRQGSSSYTLDVSTIPSNTYILDLSDSNGAHLHAQRIVLTK